MHPLASHKLRENERMNLLYESETFAVMHMLANAPVETSATSSQPQLEIQAWQQHTPTQEEVEDTLEGYTGLAQQPVLVH
jgi:hypothetical protein